MVYIHIYFEMEKKEAIKNKATVRQMSLRIASRYGQCKVERKSRGLSRYNSYWHLNSTMAIIILYPPRERE
jgi:hypothetical protein